MADWKPYTNKETGEQGWISAGGRVSYTPPPQSEDSAHVGSVTDSVLASLPDAVKSNPTFLARVKERVGKAAERAHQLYYESAFVLHKLGNVLPDIFDHPDDIKNKLGYNPSSGGVAGHQTVDPVRDATGVSTWMMASIASQVISHAVTYGARKVKGQTKEEQQAEFERKHGVAKSADADPLRQAAEALAAMFAAVAEELGLPAPVNATEVFAAELAKRAGTVTMADDVALAGSDGKELSRLMDKAQKTGAKLFTSIVTEALKRYDGSGDLLNQDELGRLAESIASVNATAELLGRYRVREQAEGASAHVGKMADDVPLKKFAESDDLDLIRTPSAALLYFQGLLPSLGVDPERFPEEQRRRAFTLAASSNVYLTQKVQDRIAEALKSSEGTADASTSIRDMLQAAGVHPANPQYAEMVFRTNAQDAYQTGYYEEGRHPDVAGTFPGWQYLGIKDGRQGKDHEPHFGKYYPAAKTFADVRGERVYNCRCGMRWVDRNEWESLGGG